jgi:hypothetical protein
MQSISRKKDQLASRVGNYGVRFLIWTVLALIILTNPAHASISVSSEAIDTLPDKIYDDLIIADRFEISAKLNEISGDLILSSEKININARLVNGNINSIGAQVFIGGRIIQSVRIYGNQISTDARIGRNLAVASFPARDFMGLGSKIELLNDCFVGKDADLYGSEIIVGGDIDGNLNATGDFITLGGEITGDATITAHKQLILLPSCRISGKLHYKSPYAAQIEEGAQVLSGDVEHIRISKERGLLDIPFNWRIILAVAAFLTGLIIVFGCKNIVKFIVEIMAFRFGQALGIGFISSLGTILYTILFLTTFMFALFYKAVFVLVPPLLIVLIAIAVAFYLSMILVAIFTGRLIITRITGKSECSPGRALLLGLIVLTGLYMIPYIGTVLEVMTAMLGFGAIAIGCYRKFRKAG